ncbi:sigma-54-dependent Fis family transcriptional regulator [Thiofaba sp. EF100]|uniref:sigma-54 interaction domain-containing protein n=1 Tax=Thiofaba sp. EF100 TaxID=3121274 RepID=UPI003221B0F1
MQASEVLVLDGDGARAAEVVKLLRFAGVPARTEAIDAPEHWRAIFFAGALAEEHEVFLAGQAERKTPLILLETDKPARTGLPASSLVARLSWPFSLPALQAVLRQADAVHPAALPPDFRPLVGESPAMQRIRGMVRKVAPSEATVLILGESGTGKEVIARNVHQFSARRDKPFIPLNCGAIPAELLESELFGHEKGAFTGALSSRPGRFELAEGGTLFLDEIGDMPMPMQVKLLRVLQERTYERVGGRETRKANVRIIAATHRDLEERIRQGEFREDLYYRLNVFPIETASLREMSEDLPLLVEEMIGRLEREGRGSLSLTPGAMAVLSRYPWPGNVRELANLIERLSILYPDQPVEIHDLPPRYLEGIDLTELASAVSHGAASGGGASSTGLDAGVDPASQAAQHDTHVSSAPADTPPMVIRPDAFDLPEEGLDLKALLEGLEVRLINQALARNDGVVAQAARMLGVRRTTLVEKMRKYGLARE